MNVVNGLDECLSHKCWSTDGEEATILRQTKNVMPSFKRCQNPYFEKC